MSRTLRIVLCNDDGIQAPGLWAMKSALTAAGHEVHVCAPDRPRSACSHSITLHKPLRVSAYTFPDGSVGHSISGTPADCVVLGLDDLVAPPVDLVVSGVNHGPNIGWDVLYSGTVAGAMEGVILGVPAIAISCASYDPKPHFETSAKVVADDILPHFAQRGLPRATLLNVNVPSLPYTELAGVRLTVQGERHYKDRMHKRSDPSGKPYYWLGGVVDEQVASDDTDLSAVSAGYASITPIDLDLTNRSFLSDLRSWRLER